MFKKEFVLIGILFLSIQLVLALPNDANTRIDFTYSTPQSINYSLVNVNNSLYWQGHTGTDGSWLTGISSYNSTYNAKAGIGNCTGKVVQNITSSGVQCVSIYNSTYNAKAGIGNCTGKVVQNITSSGVQCVSISSGGGGNPFDQSLNTTDDVTFNKVSSGTFHSDGWGTGYPLISDGFSNAITSTNLAFDGATLSVSGGFYAGGQTGISDCYDSSLGGQVCSAGGIVYSITDDPSDKTLKSGIKNLTLDVAKFDLLKPSEWTWNLTGKTGTGYGLVAQDLQLVYPQLVRNGSSTIGNKTTTYLTIDYAGIISLQTKKIQELEIEINNQNKSIIDLKTKIDKLCLKVGC